MAREFVNFQVIKERVSLQNILVHYSIDWLRPSGDELIGRCPIHQGKGTRSFHLNLTKNLFNCFSCGAKGSSVIDFVAAKEQCSVRQAALKLQAWFCVTDDTGTKTGRPPKTTPQVQKARLDQSAAAVQVADRPRPCLRLPARADQRNHQILWNRPVPVQRRLPRADI